MGLGVSRAENMALSCREHRCNNLRGRTGFDLDSYARSQAEDDGWPLKKTIKNIYANDNIDMEMAPSVAEADEILAKFGYVEEEALQMAA